MDSGAEFFVANKGSVRTIPGFEEELMKRYPVAAECEGWYLFDLRRSNDN